MNSQVPEHEHTLNSLEEKGHLFFQLDEAYRTDTNLIFIVATVPTGLEQIAKLEILEKINFPVKEKNLLISQGHVHMIVDKSQYENIIKLRSIDNVSLLAKFISKMHFVVDEEIDLNMMKSLALEHDLMPAVKTWAELTNYKGCINPSKDQHDEVKSIRASQKAQDKDKKQIVPEEIKKCDTDQVLKYRVSCQRSFTHSFTSTKAEHVYGGHLNDKYHWVVALDDFHLNVLLHIHNKTVSVLLKLTENSLHKRCLVDRGPTSLRPTIAYAMLRLCNIGPGDLVVDPMCGAGSIPIEAAYGFPKCVIICGDIHPKALERTKNNVDCMDSNINKPTISLWDATSLPVADNSIEVICSDIPFGIRTGKMDIRVLYKHLLVELARVISPKGRICLLVNKFRHIKSAITECKIPLSVRKQLKVNVGGMKCAVVLILPHKLSQDVKDVK